MRFELGSIRHLTLPKTTPPTPLGHLALAEILGGKDVRGEQRKAGSSPPSWQQPLTSLFSTSLPFAFKILCPKDILGPPGKCDDFSSPHWPCCPRLHPF